MAVHLAKRIKGLVYGRYAVLSQVWNHPLNRGSRLKALRDYFLWNAVRYSMDARHVLKLPGELEIILGKKENYGSAVYAHGLSDHGELLFLAHLMRPGDLFADIGANVGMYSVWVAGTTGANAISIEPVPQTFNALKQNIRLNDLAHLIEAHQVSYWSGGRCRADDLRRRGDWIMSSKAERLGTRSPCRSSGSTTCWTDERPTR